jgi:hypothetical protein
MTTIFKAYSYRSFCYVNIMEAAIRAEAIMGRMNVSSKQWWRIFSASGYNLPESEHEIVGGEAEVPEERSSKN